MGECRAELTGGRDGTAIAKAGMVSASDWETMPPRSCNRTGGSVWAKRGQECKTPGRGRRWPRHSREK
eukprot:3875241-Prorocentrum_lima.AAC.1